MDSDPEPVTSSRPPEGFRRGPGGEIYPTPQPVDSSRDDDAGGTRRAPRAAAPQRTPAGFKRGPGGEFFPVPRAHPPHPAEGRNDWPDSAPQSGPDIGGPVAKTLRKAFELPFFDLLGDGESTSLEGGCSGKSAEPAKCLGKTAGGAGQPDGKPTKGTSRSPRGKKPKGKAAPPIHGGWSVTATAAIAKGEPEARRNGKSFQDLDVSASVNESAGGGFDFRLFGADLSFGAEREISYQATVSEKRADRMKEGQAKAPDPYHWRSLRNGESVSYADGDADTSSGGINVGPLRFGGRGASGRSRYAGIKRVGKHQVQVSVGDEDFVRASNSIGFGVDEAHADVGSGDELRQGKQSRVTLDMRSRASRRALQSFLDDTELPAPTGKGRSDAAVEESKTWTEDASGSLTLGPSTTSESDSEHSETHSKTRYLGQGEREDVGFEHRWGDTDLEQVTRTRRDGTQAPERSEITVEDSDTDAIEEAVSLRGVRQVPEIDEGATVRIDFSEQDLEAIKGDAIANRQEEYGDDSSPEEYSETQRRRLPSYDERGTVDFGPMEPHPYDYVAAGETPSDVGKAVQLLDDGHTFVESLNELQDGTEAPGRITIFNDDGTTYVVDRDFCGRVKELGD